MTTSAMLAPLVRAVHAAQLFPDCSKTLADMPLRAAPQVVAAAFADMRLPDPVAQPEQHRTALLGFVEQWLLPVQSDSEPAGVPGLLTEGPAAGWLPRVTAPSTREWACHLYATWGSLCLQTARGVSQHPDRHTLLPAPRPFFIPGARFRECYYWDSYWVVRGLLVCGLTDAARGLVENLIWQVEQHGFVPNGLRTYYTNRSQPPLLSQMVAAVHAVVPDPAFLARALAALVQEHVYWTSAPKQVTLMGSDCSTIHSLSRYHAACDKPRPESWQADTQLCAELAEGNARQLWREVASAAESGWDFSSRWMKQQQGPGGKNSQPGGKHDLASLRTTQVIPADLNALLFQMESNISRFAAELQQAEVAQRFAAHAAARLAAVQELMWDEAGGQWRDLLLLPPQSDAAGSHTSVGGQPGSSGTSGVESAALGAAALPPASESPGTGAASAGPQRAGAEQQPLRWERSTGAYASNWVPLYCGCAPAGSPQAAAAVAGLRSSGLIQQGGAAASLYPTGEQWDWPCVWPPLQCMLTEGCAAYGGQEGDRLAAELAQQYLSTAHAAWKTSGRMWEKFDATAVGAAGHGGEYEVVDGFGWTNGVALLLLERYGWQEE